MIEKNYYYSEILNKEFKTKEECLKAEEEYAAAKTETDKKKQELSVERKKYADKVHEAEKALEEAYAKLDSAQDEAEKLRTEFCSCLEELRVKYRRLITDALSDAQLEVEEAQKARRNAIQEYNENCGKSYVKVYTGAQASSEYNRWLKTFSQLFDIFDKIVY